MGLTQITTGGVDDNINIDGDTLKVDGVNNRVGVGITPTAPLHVSGTIQSQTGSTVAQMFTDGGAAYFTSVGSYPMLFQTNGNERMRIDSSGRLLVGTSSASGNNLLQIEGDAADVQNPGGIFLRRGLTSAEIGSVTGRDLGIVNFGTKNGDIGAQIFAESDATMSTGDSPGRLVFGTTADGASSPTERMRIDSSGRVVIGATSTPVQFSVQNASTSLGIEVDTASGFASGPTLRGYYRPGSAYKNLGITGAQIMFGINDVEKARIDSSGNVGVGHTNPSAFGKFVVSGTGNLVNLNASSGAASLKFYENGSGRFNLDTLNGSVGLAFKNGSSEFARIDSSGRLLVGTTTNSAPAGYNAKLQLADTSYTGSISMRRDSNDAGSQALIFGKSRGALNGNTIVQNNDTLGYIVWYGADGTDLNSTAAQIHVQIDGTPGSNDMPGRIVFSTTTDGSSAPSAHMIINRNGECRIGHGDSDPVSTDMVHSIQDPNLGAVTSNLARLVMQERAGNWISFKSGSGTHYGTISQNGSGVSYGSNSDYRLKNNVENFTGGIALVKQLRPVTFNWNELSGNSDTTSTQRGFIAHEVQAVEPTAVTGEKDEMDRYGDCYDAEGRKTQTNVFERQAKEGETWTFQSEEIRDQQLDPAKLVPILTAALQEAIAKIETLETKVAALEAAE